MHSSPGIRFDDIKSDITELPKDSRTPTYHPALPPANLNTNFINDVHPGLRPLLTTTAQPHEIYSSLHQSRERRLRVLLRRLVNQIQYGCRNTRCDTPTCLSYRKRESIGPVRLYSDVVARALAWKCLEQYAKDGRDIYRTEEKSNKGRCKRRVGGQNDPFCCNEPVIPWYSDPSEFLKKRRDNSLEHINRNSTKVEGPKPVKGATRRTSPTRSMSSTLPQGLIRHSTDLDPTPSEIRVPDDQQAGNILNQERDFGDLSNSAAQLENPSKHDPASFAQFLFNQESIQRFYQPPKVKSQSVDAINALRVNDLDGDRMTDSSCHNKEIDQAVERQITLSRTEQIGLQATTSVLCHVHTFKSLPASAILWLKFRLRESRRREAAGCNSDQSQQTSLKELRSLAHQSLHFVLSQPLRLIESAEKWDFIGHSAGRPYDLPTHCPGIDQIHDLVSDVVEKEQCSTRLPRTCLPSWDSIHGVCTALQSIIAPNGTALIADYLFAALQHSYVLPHQASSALNPGIATSASNESEEVPLHDLVVAHLLILTIGLINGLTYGGGTALDRYYSSDFSHFHVMHPNSFIVARGTGQVYPQTAIKQMYQHLSESMRTAICREFLRNTYWSNDPVIDRLLESIADIIGHRLALFSMEKTRDTSTAKKRLTGKMNIVQSIVQTLRDPPVRDPEDVVLVGDHYSLRLLLHMQHVLLSKWDRNPVIRRTSSVGGALEMLAEMYRKRQVLRFEASYFQMQTIAGALNEIDMPFEWLSFQKDGQKMHILQFAFLFDAATLVRYFRSINLKAMQQAHEHALAVYLNAKTHLIHTPIPVYGIKEILEKTRPHMARYFVMTISRQNVLEDAMNQIWKRQRQELMRPLKVQVDKDDGEDGLDHGGVQQEFFRLVFAEALNPDFGMFVIDETTRMTWFQPASIEPLYKFEALGVLLSLAVYNSITMPLTFPLAFYRKLLGMKVKTLEHVEDGWPVLAQNLKVLLKWSDGDVGDVIMRTYEFSYDAYGQPVTIDMEKTGREDIWPSVDRRMTRNGSKTASFNFPLSPSNTSPSTSPVLDSKADHTLVIDKGTTTPLSLESPSEANLVTNENREQYVKDYVFWLTDKSVRPQFEAFARGFHTCLSRTALSIFTPEALKQVIEGHQEIDIDGLEHTASYDDFSTTDQIIKDFWSVVRDFSPDQHGKLLEFVTASNRVPVNGIESITFTIQKNGEGDDRLPSSSTCYGRLLLPNYSGKDVLRTKLEKAIENSVGFGSL